MRLDLSPARSALAGTHSGEALARWRPCLDLIGPDLVRRAAQAAQAVLPGWVSLDNVTVVVVVDGSRAARAEDDGQVFVDLLGLPPSNPGLFLVPVLTHELHHLGFTRARSRDPQPPRPEATTTLVGILADLVMEGVANAYFTPSDLSWLDPATSVGLSEIGFGPSAVDDFRRSVVASKARFPELLAELERILEMLLDAALDTATVPSVPAAAASYAATLKDTREDLARPVAHLVGEMMIQAIRAHAGDGAVIRAVARLSEFLPAYQEACSLAGWPSVNPGLIARIGEALSKVRSRP